MIRHIALCASLVVTFASVSVAPAAADDSAGWTNNCPFTHRSMDDPIVYPGQPGAAHMHDFQGNTTTDADSTYETLIAGTSTCHMPADRAAYWFPTMMANGSPRGPREFVVYYRARVRPYSAVRPFPPGLRMIAGDHEATHAQPYEVIDWACGDGVERRVPHDCPGEPLVAHVKFPECWDGVHKDSADHMSHMAYPREVGDRYFCPKSHPVRLPRIKFRIEWSVHTVADISFSSGPWYTLHGDFINSWRQPALRRLTRRCIDANRDCGAL
jgi:hypothetical protein